jgi:hypothetical protein
MMIDRCSNKVVITSQDRLQPMDKWEDYPIKVLDIAPLILVMQPTVYSFFSTYGCFLRDGRSSSRDLPPLSILWMASRCEWLSPCEWRCLQDFRVEDPSGARNGGPNWPPGVGQAGRTGSTGPGPSRPGSAAPSLLWVLRWICTLPLPFAWFQRCHPRVQDRGSLCMKFGLLHFNPRGCSFVALRSLPLLEVISSSSWTWTRLRKCSFKLVVNPSFMSMFSCIKTTLPNACTYLNLLYDKCA